MGDPQHDVGGLEGISQLEPSPPPLHPFPDHRQHFFKLCLQRSIDPFVGMDEHPKRLGRTPGGSFLPDREGRRRHKSEARESGSGPDTELAERHGQREAV